MTKSLIDGKEIFFFSDKLRQPLVHQSMIVIGSMICLVVGVVSKEGVRHRICISIHSYVYPDVISTANTFTGMVCYGMQVISIYIVRNALAKSIGSQAQLVASLANALQIQIFNYLYSLLADSLTERENHRTDTEFEDSMIAKTFLFQVYSCNGLCNCVFFLVCVHIAYAVCLLLFLCFSLSTRLLRSFTLPLWLSINLALRMWTMSRRSTATVAQRAACVRWLLIWPSFSVRFTPLLFLLSPPPSFSSSSLTNILFASLFGILNLCIFVFVYLFKCFVNLLVTRVVIGNATELVLPLLQNRRAYNKELQLSEGKTFIRVEEEFMLTKVSLYSL
jgi:hypothetical protein